MSMYRPLYERSHALLIGIDEYPHFPPLQTAVKGVRELAQVLRDELGFQQITTLENERATLRNIRRRLDDPLSHREQVGPDDRVLIYFAGHGITVDIAVGEVGYLVPFDAEPGHKDTLLAMDELTRVAADWIHAKHVLFLLDACFSGFASTRMTEGIKRQLSDYLTLPTRQVITAGTRDQQVSDLWGPGGHSLFTGFLLDGLRGAAPMPGGVLRAFHLAGWLQDQVAQHSRARQTPLYASLMGSRGGDLIFSVREVVELPRWVVEVAESNDSTQRLVAVGRLSTLAQDQDTPEMASQALAKLQELTRDPSAMVASSAQGALRELMPETEVAPVDREEPVVVEPEPTPVKVDAPEPTPPRARRGIRPLWVGFGVVALVGLVIGALAISGMFGGRPTPTPEPTTDPAIALALSGVARNADWTPHTQEFNGVEVALVPAGCFMMGTKDSGSDEWPIHEVCFDEPFWIDMYEVTNEQFGSVGCAEYSSEDDQPRNCVSWTDAATYCKSRDARLPTEAEWEYAARGPDGLVYPWGDEFDCSMGNFDDETEYNSYVADGRTNCDGFVVTAPVGSFPDGASWVGALDLGGNLWEWVADWHGTYPSGKQVNPTGPNSGQYRVLRGSSWGSPASPLRAAARLRSLPGFRYDYSGFRCARSWQEPEPAPTDTPAPTTPPPSGLEPVTRNADWTPVIEEFDGVEMALVPAGCFMMGSEDGGDDEKPVHEVCFEEPFWIDVYEVTNKQYGSEGYYSGSTRPRESVTWTEAVAHCESRSARLPTEAEWEYAARGPDGLAYPWGNEFVPDNVVYYGNSDVHTWWVGSKPGGISWVGAFDMSGNVEEWVSTWYAPYPYNPADGREERSNPGGYDGRVLRGGSWYSNSSDLHIANRSRYYPVNTWTFSGFRCARSY